MIRGIGIDQVEIVRFACWRTKSAQQLERIFSAQESAYALQSAEHTNARFAARFAAKEAFLKAYQAYKPDWQASLWRIARAVQVTRTSSGLCILEVDWQSIYQLEANLHAHLSLTHSKTHAIACVIIEENSG